MHLISCRESGSSTRSFRVDKVFSQLYVAPHGGIVAGTYLICMKIRWFVVPECDIDHMVGFWLNEDA